MERIEWLDSLCPRLQHLLQVEFCKSFEYDFHIAHQAVINSKEMLNSRLLGHIFPIQSPALAEAVAYTYVRGDDEWALRKIVGLYRESDKHSEILRKFGVIGIGFAYSDKDDILYNSIRLR
jgi:hypothetical protein